MTMALAYLLSVVFSLAVLAVALRRRPVSPPASPPRWPAPQAAIDPGAAAAEVRVILTAAAQLAARLTTAA
ncbi:hypothetical protein [Streptomyces virginiae]|uniref:hypothetical protein n=1 Tax=Streptomyces virginiae TaxID=1961 RepID=UPI00378BCBA5